MSSQETFDTVVRHARTQQKKAKDAFGNCRYRTTDGLACFAGCLIPDADMVPAFEFVSVSKQAISSSSVLVTGYFRSRGFCVDLVGDLQRVHDSCDVATWEQGLSDVAQRFGLTYCPPVA